MKEFFALEHQQELKSELLILPDVTEDKERKKAEALMKPVDASQIKIPRDITDEKFDQVIYREPVITCSGNTYESEKISAWLEKKNTDPSDNIELENKNLIPNKSCISRVNKFLDENPQLRDSAELYLPRHWVGELDLACQKGDLEVIKHLYDLDRRLFSWTFDFTEEKYSAYQGKNILHITCKQGTMEAIVRLLEFMEKRAEGLALLMLLQRDKQGKLPIQYAMENETNPRLMRVLALKTSKYLNGVEPVLLSISESQEHRYRTALHIAAMNNDANTISFLVEHKADLNIKDNFGNTALHIALGYGANEAVQALIRAGASEEIENDQRQTPEKVGEANGKPETVQILKEALEQRTKTQQDQLKDAGPLAQMVLGMKASRDQLAAKNQKQEKEIEELQTAITLLCHEIGYLRLTGHFLNRETLYNCRNNQNKPKVNTEEIKTFWEPKRFGIDKPLSKKELRKLVLQDLSPHTQQALFYVEEKRNTNYQFSQLPKGKSSVTALNILPDGNIISGYQDGTIKIWDSKGTLKGVKQSEDSDESKIYALTILPNGSFMSRTYNNITIWNIEGKCLSTIKADYMDVWGLEVLPDGKILIGEKNSLKIWEQKGDCTGTIEMEKKSRNSLLTRLAVLPDGKIVVAEDESLKIWDQQGKCTAIITWQKSKYKRVIIDSKPPLKVTPGILYITVDEKDETCNMRSTEIKQPISFKSDKLKWYVPLTRGAFDLPQDITHVDKIKALNDDIFKFNNPIWLTSLAIWNDRIVVGLEDKSIKVWKADGNFLVTLLGHSVPVHALTVLSDGNLVSGDDAGVLRFWDNNFNSVSTLTLDNETIYKTKAFQAFKDETLIVEGKEGIIFCPNTACDRPIKLLVKPPYIVFPDAQAILHTSEEEMIIKYVFFGKRMMLDLSFQKELLLANAKLHQLNQGLMIKTIRPCLEALAALGATLQKLCSEFQLNIEFGETEMRISNLTDVELIADLESLCQLFGAAIFIPAPTLVVNPAAQSGLEEFKKHRVTGSLIPPPLTSPITMIGSNQRQAAKKDYFNTKENDGFGKGMN